MFLTNPATMLDLLNLFVIYAFDMKKKIEN